MKWAIVFYAMLTINGETKEHISWGIAFNHHEKCFSFYERNKDEIIAGLKSFAQKNVDPNAQLVELGCAHATANFEDDTQPPVVTLKMPLWNGEHI
tara:strand:- start:2206 stop:2493 length:288 start_codon:yes stop_codon:yes gene_type:complete